VHDTIRRHGEQAGRPRWWLTVAFHLREKERAKSQLRVTDAALARFAMKLQAPPLSLPKRPVSLIAAED
jgi:hypothetical protein